MQPQNRPQPSCSAILNRRGAKGEKHCKSPPSTSKLPPFRPVVCTCKTVYTGHCSTKCWSAALATSVERSLFAMGYLSWLGYYRTDCSCTDGQTSRRRAQWTTPTRARRGALVATSAESRWFFLTAQTVRVPPVPLPYRRKRGARSVGDLAVCMSASAVARSRANLFHPSPDAGQKLPSALKRIQ